MSEEDELIIPEKKTKGNSQLRASKSQMKSNTNNKENIIEEETKNEESSLLCQEPILSVNDIKQEEVTL